MFTGDFIKKSGLVLLGGTVQGIGMGIFLFPQAIPSGGAGGLAILLNYLFDVNLGLGLWIVNFSLLLVGISYLGKWFTAWTIMGMTMTSLSLDFFESTLVIHQRNIVVDLILGSIFLGIGIGILMRQGVSNGGVGVLAYMISFKWNILPGQPLFIINCFIFFITAAIISWKVFFLALISQWIATRIVNLICHVTVYETYTLDWNRKT